MLSRASAAELPSAGEAEGSTFRVDPHGSRPPDPSPSPDPSLDNGIRGGSSHELKAARRRQCPGWPIWPPRPTRT
eukprot:5691037-Prymnesium_polylepis.1